jgi:hypothetical protein
MAKMTASNSLFSKNLRANPWRSIIYESNLQIKAAQLFKNLEFNEKLFLFFDPNISGWHFQQKATVTAPIRVPFPAKLCVEQLK